MRDGSCARFEQGLDVRRQVLGDDYVDRALGQASEFMRPMQELLTEYCWGAVWGRPGLERKVRSLINIGLLTVLDRPDELRAHVRGALTNGCTITEIRRSAAAGRGLCWRSRRARRIPGD